MYRYIHGILGTGSKIKLLRQYTYIMNTHVSILWN